MFSLINKKVLTKSKMAFFYYNGTSHGKKRKDIVNTIQFFQGLQIDNMTQA